MVQDEKPLESGRQTGQNSGSKRIGEGLGRLTREISERMAAIDHTPHDHSQANRAGEISREIAWIVLICLIGICARAWVFVHIENALHADEAVQGIIARHILGGEIQLFTYGLSYLGTLQAHWIALCFALFGDTTLVLRWAAGVESLFLIVAVYLLGREIGAGDKRVGRLAALLVALGPLYLIEWSLRPRGGNIQVPIFSALALWMTLRACRLALAAQREPAPPLLGPARRRLVAAGFVLGVSWWCQFSAIYAILTCGIVFLIWGGDLRRDWKTWLFGSGAFLAGSSPFWLYNIRFHGASLGIILASRPGGHGLAGLIDRGTGFVTTAVPVLLGARQTEALQSFGALAVLAAVVSYGGLLAAAAFRRGPAPEHHTGPKPPGAAAGFLFLAVAVSVYIISSFGSYPLEPRYILSLYAVLGPLTALGAIRCWDARAAWRGLAVVLLALILGTSFHGYWRGERSVMQPWGQGQRIPTDLSPLIAFLDDHGVSRVFTNFYVGYRLAWETEERIVACTEGDPIQELYAPYRDAVRSADPPAGFIVGPDTGWWLAEALRGLDIAYSSQTVQGFVVFYGLNAPFTVYPPSIRMFFPADIRVGAFARECRPGTRFDVEVTVTNRSPVAWSSPPHDPSIQLSYHIIDAATETDVRFDNRRFPFGRTVKPGESVTLTMTVEAPREAGRYAFVPDLVMERRCWFTQMQTPNALPRSANEFRVTP